MGHSNKLTLPGIPKITHVKLSINFLNRTRKVVDTNWLGSHSDHRNTQSLRLPNYGKIQVFLHLSESIE